MNDHLENPHQGIERLVDSIELVFQGATELMGGCDIALLVLTDNEGKRQISIIVDKLTEKELMLHRSGEAITQDRLPEVLCSLFPELCKDNFYIYIYGVKEGKYLAFLAERQGQRRIPIRISDAILLAQVAKLCIYIDSVLFGQQSVPFDAESRKMALPLNTLNIEMLHKMLEKAVAEEDYERAAIVKHEIEQRSNGSVNIEDSAK